MKTIHASSIEEAKQLIENMSKPKVDGSLEIVIDKFKLSLETKGMDAQTTIAVLKAAFDAATQPSYIITYDPDRSRRGT